MKQVLTGTLNSSMQMLVFGSAELQGPLSRNGKKMAKKMSTLAPTRDQGYNQRPRMTKMSTIQQPK